MRICLIGYGKMGQIIESLAIQKGHIITGRISSKNRNQLADYLSDSDVAIEFSSPDCALEHITICFEHQVPIVCGTTGWLDQWDEMLTLRGMTDGAILWASNFSIGVNILFAVNRYLATLMSPLIDYKPKVAEIHHIHKKDSPSGTALSLTKDILATRTDLSSWSLDSKQNSALYIDAKRTEDVVGYHNVSYESKQDIIEISHNAYSREGFASGAILAAEWLQGKTGCYGMKDVLGIG